MLDWPPSQMTCGAAPGNKATVANELALLDTLTVWCMLQSREEQGIG